MNSIIEKEKKLNEAISELKNLDLSNPNLKNNIDNLSYQKTKSIVFTFWIKSSYFLLLIFSL